MANSSRQSDRIAQAALAVLSELLLVPKVQELATVLHRQLSIGEVLEVLVCTKNSCPGLPLDQVLTGAIERVLSFDNMGGVSTAPNGNLMLTPERRDYFAKLLPQLAEYNSSDVAIAAKKAFVYWEACQLAHELFIRLQDRQSSKAIFEFLQWNLGSDTCLIPMQVVLQKASTAFEAVIHAPNPSSLATAQTYQQSQTDLAASRQYLRLVLAEIGGLTGSTNSALS